MSLAIQAVLSMLLQRKRTCPKCARDQVVPLGKRFATVRCKFCGAPLPPPKR